MKSLIIIAALCALAQASEWEDFKAKFGKQYGTVGEHDTRKAIFEENLKLINQHNAEAASGAHTYTLAVNELADLTHGERVTKLTGAVPPKTDGESVVEYKVDTSIPDSMDWRDEGYVTPVKNQGQCGSCWTFSTTGAVEGAYMKKTGKLVSLSEQDLVDCAKHAGNGCYGGRPDLAMDFIIQREGIDTEESYPYEARNGKCRYDENSIGATIAAHYPINRMDEDHLTQILGTVGPVAVAIDAGTEKLHFYHSGVFSDPECSSFALNHAVLAVGYGTLDGQDYYIVKNSWGKLWGEEGYVLMERGSNMCGIATDACYPIA